jgi:hypothetical protein
MPFNVNDIYTSSGSVMLQNSWTPYVSKFDTSSFYNWEQDNLPLYDLEERTFENWEQAGYPTSAVTGFALTVSADAATTTEGQAAMLANNNLFSNLSSCIAAIPKVVRFPVLVEVGSFGDLGKLELHNFRIEEGGSIEIINRNFGRVLNASGDCEDVVATPTYNRSHALLTTVSSMDLSTTLTETKCVHLNQLVLSAAGGMDARCKNNGNSVFYPKHTLRKAPLTVALDSATPMTANANRISFPPYENIDYTSVDATLNGLDMSATNQATDNELYRLGLSDPERLSVGGNTYFNNCSKISVKNCDGPIYIRNFFVDGATTEPVAIEVTNSEVLLENCAAIRAQEAGFKFNNSKITLSRSAASYRNYKMGSTVATRETGVGYGFHAINSDILVSSLPIPMQTTTVGDEGASGVDCVVMASRNYAGWVLDNSKLSGGVQRAVATQALDSSIIGSELNTGYGMLLYNSHVNVKGLLDIYGDDKGIQSDNSHVVFQNLCIDAHSNEAIRSRNSSFLFDSPTSPLAAGQSDRMQLDMSANSQHIDLMKNSSFGFRRKNNIPTTYGNTSFKVAHGVIKYNGGNKSTLPALSVNDGSELDLIHAAIHVSGTSENIVNVPSYGRAVKATSNSKVSCFGSGSGCTFVFGPPGITYQAKMAGMYASDSSEINIHGPAALAQFGVDILVEDNSTLNIEPARLRDSFGLEVSGFDLSSQANHTSVELHATRACLVANKNSTINMADLGDFHANWARTSTGQGMVTAGVDYPTVTFDTSAFTSSGSLQFYPNPQDTSAINDDNLDDLAAGLSFSMPNIPVFTATTGMNRFFLTANIINANSYTNLDKITQGGVCLRATQDSVVNARNVHFPLGTNSSPLDGHYYTTSGTDCEKLMIWNIADTSRLNASFLSVSGTWPGSSQYHGPSSIYVSSYNGTLSDGAVASGAPSGTPDTGQLSVLDAFGAGSSVWIPASGSTVNTNFNAFYPLSANAHMNSETAELLADVGINVSGTATYKWGAGPNESANQGVFRIYWSPKPAAKALQSDLSGYYKGAFPNDNFGAGTFSGAIGPAYQTFAQGYNCSGPLSAILLDSGSNVSGTYPELLKLSYDTNYDGTPDQLWTSGFYYCKEFVEDNPTQCMLDESASLTFANAKNASVGFAGRPKKVTVYSSRSDARANRTAEAYVGDASGSLGFKSSSIFDLSRDN